MYNSNGWRVKKDNGIERTYYLYGKGQQVLEERDETGNIKKLFIYGNNGRIGFIDDNGDLQYIINDILGSNSVIIDESGKELARYKYSPFGNLINSEGMEDISYRYTGKEFDGTTGLYYYGARYYDPTIGRFITEDPIQDGWNWFVYTANNPLKYVDPDGLYYIYPFEYQGKTYVGVDSDPSLLKTRSFLTWIPFFDPVYDFVLYKTEGIQNISVTPEELAKSFTLSLATSIDYKSITKSTAGNILDNTVKIYGYIKNIESTIKYNKQAELEKEVFAILDELNIKKWDNTTYGLIRRINWALSMYVAGNDTAEEINKLYYGYWNYDDIIGWYFIEGFYQNVEGGGPIPKPES